MYRVLVTSYWYPSISFSFLSGELCVDISKKKGQENQQAEQEVRLLAQDRSPGATKAGEKRRGKGEEVSSECSIEKKRVQEARGLMRRD